MPFMNILALVVLAVLAATTGWIRHAGAQSLQPETGTPDNSNELRQPPETGITANPNNLGQQSLLPETGTSTSDLRQQLESMNRLLETGGAPAAPGWTVVPSLDLSEEWTDNGGNGSRNGQDSFITVIQPGVLVNADTNRVKGTLSYTPELYLYNNSSGQSWFSNNFNANATITLVPEHFFVNLQGFGATQATSGGTAPSTVTTLSRQNTTQSYSYSATPYFRNRFGDIGTGEVGVSVANTSQQNLGDQTFVTPLAANTNQNMHSTQEYLTFTSGPALGRSTLIGSASAMQMGGSGVSDGAYRNVVTVNYGYAVTRGLTPFVIGGYEDIRYHTLPIFLVNDAIWRVGAHWVPNPDSSVTLSYGHQDGFNSARFDGSYALTARVRLYGRYSETLLSGLEALADAVSSSVLDPLGNPIDPTTGAPLFLTDNFLGVQNNNVLFHTKVGSVTATVLFDRDAISLSIVYQSQKPVGFAPGSGAILSPSQATSPTQATYGSINWEHEFSPDLRMNAFFQDGRTNNTLVATNNFLIRRNNQTVNSLAASSVAYLLFQPVSGRKSSIHLHERTRAGTDVFHQPCPRRRP